MSDPAAPPPAETPDLPKAQRGHQQAAPPQSTSTDASRAALDRARIVDGLCILPFAGLLVFASPILNALEGFVFGMPTRATFLFAVWATLILIGRRLARRVMQDG